MLSPEARSYQIKNPLSDVGYIFVPPSFGHRHPRGTPNLQIQAIATFFSFPTEVDVKTLHILAREQRETKFMLTRRLLSVALFL